MEIKILYEDSDVVAVNKPAGLIVHSDGKTKEPNLTDWVLKKYPDAKDVGEPIVQTSGEKIIRPGIVHRLDRETSGVLLIAKNQKAFEFLKKQFQDRETKKTYNAFVYGEVKLPPNNRGIIDRPIGRSKGDFRKWTAGRGARGEMRDAVTEYKILNRNGGFTFLELSPKTGRTHQIRVHLKAINHPVVCDSLYAPGRKSAFGFERTALHATSIEFKNLDFKEVKVAAPFPEDFLNAIGQIKKSI